MLDPQDRQLLLDALRPPPGATLDAGVGTTFTLDLEALLLAPLSFALFDTEEAERDPTALLAAIEQNASKLALYCDQAHIRSKPSEQKLFVLLEPTVVPVAAPGGGAFHPKVWVLRFVWADGTVSHRLLVLSRNLTFDTSWDLVAALDEDPAGALRGQEVAELLDDLDRLGSSVIVRDLSRSVRRARFAVPEPFETARLHTYGLQTSGPDPLEQISGDRALVVSPFLTAPRLEQLERLGGARRTLVSRPAELERIGGDAVREWGIPMILSDAADGPADEAGRLRGLHAKLYVTEAEEKATWYLGSANATSSGARRNVEMLLELEGPSRKAGVGALLSEAGKEVRFRTLLKEFPLVDPEPRAKTDTEEDEDRLDELVREFCAEPLDVKVVPDGEGWNLNLETAARLNASDGADLLDARPVTRSSWKRADLASRAIASVQVPRVSEITSLIAFRLTSGVGLAEPREFVLRGRLRNAPLERLDQLFIDLIPDKRRFALLLFLMLAAGDPDAVAAAQARQLIEGGGNGYERDGDLGIPLYEALVRASARDRARLRAVDQVVSRLTATEEGRGRLPDGFAEMWASFRPLIAKAGA